MMSFTRSMLLYLAILAGAGVVLSGGWIIVDAMYPTPDPELLAVR